MLFCRENRIRFGCLLLGLGIGVGFHYWAEERQGSDATANPNSVEAQALLQKNSKVNPNGKIASGGAGSSVEKEPLEVRVRTKYQPLLSDTNRFRRLSHFLTGLEEMTPEEVPIILKMIGEFDREGMHFSAEWPAFIRRWGEIDGKSAAEHALRSEGDGWTKSGMKDIFSGWASKNPSEAAEWLNAHGDSKLFDSALQGIVSGMSETNPFAATKVAQDSLPPDRKDLAWQLTEAITEAVVRQNKRSGMVEWYENLPATGTAEPLKTAAFGHVWWRLNHADPKAAAGWLTSQADKPWRNDEQYALSTRKLAEANPTEALNWAGSLPPSPTTADWPGVASTFRQWMGRVPAEAEAYARKLPNTPFGDFVRKNCPNISAP